MDEAPRGGDEIGVRLHLRELLRADHAAALPGQRAIDRDVIGALQQFVELDLLRAPFRDFRSGKIGVVGQHIHAEQALAELGDAAADIADADNADGAALRLGADQRIAVDVAIATQRAVGLDDALRQRQQHAERVFGDRMRVAAGLVDHEHACLGAGLDIDGIEACAVA